jgi:hypothetical protein
MNLPSLRSLALVCTALVALSAARAAETAAPNFVSIFNGKDLTGWKPNGDPSIWSVQDGALVGRSNPQRKGSTIDTEKSYKNFIIECDVKYLPPADSGIEFRQPRLQMQIGTSASLRIELTGSFYLGALSYTDNSTAKDTWKVLKHGDWNHIRLEARGAIFTVWINGQMVHRYADAGHPDAGPISLQVHDNFDMKIEFKNIRVAELK